MHLSLHDTILLMASTGSDPPLKWIDNTKVVCAVFGLFIILVAPNMKVDPEEMAKMQEEMKDSPLSFLMGGQPPQGASSTTGSAVTAGATATTAVTSTGTSKRSGKRR